MVLVPVIVPSWLKAGGAGRRVRVVPPEVECPGGAGARAGGCGGGAGAGMTAGAGEAGEAGVGPGMPQSCVFHSGIPMELPVSSMLLTHCEKEFQNFLSSDVNGSKSRS